MVYNPAGALLSCALAQSNATAFGPLEVLGTPELFISGPASHGSLIRTPTHR